MREALAELVRLVTQFRHGIPWQENEDAYQRVPLLAIIFAVSISVALAGSFWYVSSSFYFNPWAMLILIVPASSGFYLTYFFDLLGIGLGWRGIDIFVQLALGFLVFNMSSNNVFGLGAGLLTAICAWVTGVRCGSDLVAMRPDKLTAGYFDEKGALSHPGLQRLYRSQLTQLVIVAFAVGFLARWQNTLAPWWVSAMVGISSAIALITSLVISGGAQQAVELRTWEENEVLVQPGIITAWRGWAKRLAGAVGLVGLILPANLSPLGRISFDGIFNGLNARISPYFVRTGTYSSSVPSSVGAKLAQRVEHMGNPHIDGVLSALLYVVLAVGAVWIIRLLWPLLTGQPAQRPAYYGKERGLWKWLWDTIRAWFRRATGIILYGTADDEQAASSIRQHGKSRKRRHYPKEPQALVRFLFALFLEKGAESGRARQHEETVAEYRDRLLPELAPEAAVAVDELTNMYEQVRYGQQLADAKFAGLFKRCWALAIRAIRYVTS